MAQTMVESMEALSAAFNATIGVTSSELGKALQEIGKRLIEFNSREESYIGPDTTNENGSDKFLEQKVESEVLPERGKRAQSGIYDDSANPFIDNSEFEKILSKYSNMESDLNVYFSNDG